MKTGSISPSLPVSIPAAIPWRGMGLGFLVAFLLGAAILAARGADENGLKAALFITARWSFVLFFLAYAGGAIARLSGGRLSVLARGREFGLSFAAAHLVHLLLVAWLWIVLHHAPLAGGLLVFFLVAVGFTYLLAALSFGAWPGMMRGPAGRILVLVALNYILLAFARDFIVGFFNALGPEGSPRQLAEYVPFAALCLVAPLLRILAAQIRLKPAAAQ